MQMMGSLVLMLAASPALAAEVIWLSPPSESDQTWVADNAGATGPVLAPIDLRAAASDWSETDSKTYADLEATLREVRAYESKLDGELLIMRDLSVPIDKVTVIRNEDDRNQLFAALTYQGFAVNRYFGPTLAEDDKASDYRVEADGHVIERPWADAAAIEPDREATPYEIAEAPQRVAYTNAAKMVADGLPASFTPVGLPEGADLFVDGRQVEVGAAGNLKIVPGRHWIHVSLEDRVIARWDVRLGPADSVEAGPELTEQVWTGFLEGLLDGASVPDALHPSLEALGGEVWIARPGEKRPDVFAITADGVRAVTLAKPTTNEPGAAEAPDVAVGVTAGAAGAWMYSGDFYAQDPTLDNHDKETVNAMGPVVYASLDLRAVGMMFSAGIDATYATGEGHAAFTGDSSMRLRAYPHVAIGVPVAQVTAGFLLPYHPGLGARATLPLGGPVVLRAHGMFGVPGTLQYDDGAVYETYGLFTAGLGAGVRF